jgi:hypothetical protein
MMHFQSALAKWTGLRSLIVKTVRRLFRNDSVMAFAKTYVNTQILVEPDFSYKLCRFVKCEFGWPAEGVAAPTKIFFACSFDDCEIAMPLREFLAYNESATIDQELQSQVARRIALEEAVRRTRRRHPFLTAKCLDPCCQEERQFIARLVSAEYSTIVAEAA